jgi:hypothetical protein
MPAIFFFGSLTLLNLKQKAEKTLIPFPRAGQFPRPTNDFVRRESLLVNLEFWIIAWPLIHTSSGAINFLSDSHASRYNFETLEGMLRSIPKYRPTKARGSGELAASQARTLQIAKPEDDCVPSKC